MVNTKYIHKYNVILNKTATKLVTILTQCSFSYLNPTQTTLNNFSFWCSFHIFLHMKCFLNSKPLWKHVFLTRFLMFLQIAYIKWEQKIVFKNSLELTKSQSTWYLSNNYAKQNRQKTQNIERQKKLVFLKNI